MPASEPVRPVPRRRARRRRPRPCAAAPRAGRRPSMRWATSSMKCHCSTERFTAADLVLGVRVEVEAQPLAVGAVVGAAQLERELDGLHERRGADHVVVVEDAPAGVGVLVAEQPLGGQQRRVLGQVLAVHEQVLPVHVDLDVVDPLGAQLVDDVQRHPDVAHEDLHGRLGVLVLEEERLAVGGQRGRGLADPVDEARPRVGVGGLERVVVALDPRPDDEVRADLAGELAGVERDLDRRVAHAVVGRGERALAECAGRGAGRWPGSRCRGRRAPRGPRRGCRR